MNLSDCMKHIFIEEFGQVYRTNEQVPDDWIAVDLPDHWDLPWKSEAFEFAFNRGWEFGAVNTWKQVSVGHVEVTRFLFPPTDRENAMLFKLTWGGK
jgi:hypothetical protein